MVIFPRGNETQNRASFTIWNAVFIEKPFYFLKIRARESQYGLIFFGVGKIQENMGAIWPVRKHVKNARFRAILPPPPSSMLILKKGSSRFCGQVFQHWGGRGAGGENERVKWPSGSTLMRGEAKILTLCRRFLRFIFWLIMKIVRNLVRNRSFSGYPVKKDTQIVQNERGNGNFYSAHVVPTPIKISPY